MAARQRQRPVLVFDGDCAFCTSSVRALERLGAKVDAVAWQRADLGELGLTEREAADAVQLIEVDGGVRAGHQAIAAALATAGPIWRAAGRALTLPGISPLAARGYRLVADNRGRLPGGAPACTPANGSREGSQ